MAESDGEHNLRYMLLLGEGVPFVLRAIITKESKTWGKSLTEILAPREQNLRGLFKHDSQFKKLFPSKGNVNAELDTWDIGLLSQIVLDIFGQDLTHQERLLVKSFGYSRADLIHRALTVFEEHEFTRELSDLVVVLLHLSARIDQETYEKCQDLVKDSASLDVPALMVRLRASNEYDNKMVAEVDGSVKKRRSKHETPQKTSTELLKEYEFLMRRFDESLTKSRLKGIDFTFDQVIECRIEVRADTAKLITRGTLLLLNAFHIVLGKTPESHRCSGVKMANEKILEAARSVISLVHSVEGVSVHEVLYNDVLLRLKCANVRCMRQVLKKLQRPEFKALLDSIKDALKETYGEKFKIKSHIIESCVHETESHLHEKGLIIGTYDDLNCKAGHAQPVVMFCNDDDDFCCHICALHNHRACPGIRQTTQAEKINYTKKEMKEYTARVDQDDAICWINGVCMLPSGEILITDENNKRLKKLDSTFNVVSHVELPNAPYDVCAMENDLAAVALWGKTIQVMNVKEHLVVDHSFELEHSILGLLYSRKKFYVSDDRFVYTYNHDGSGKHLLYKSDVELVCFSKMTFSGDGEKIFIVDGYGGLETIDRKGNHLFTLREDVLKMSRGICLSKDKTILVCEYEYNTILHLDPDGERIFGTVLAKSHGINRPTALLFDKKTSKLIVFQRDKHTFLVYEIE